MYSRTSVIRISIVQTLGYPNAIMNAEIPKVSSTTQVINGMLVRFLDLLGLLYHSTVDRRHIVDTILLAAHASD